MTIRPSDAAHALDTAAEAQRRGLASFRHRLVGTYVLLWALLWVVGYSTNAFAPAAAHSVWLVVWAIGFALPAIYILAFRPGLADRRLATAILAILTFGQFALWLIEASPRQAALFWPLLVALAYVLLGLWTGWRITLAGFAFAALTVIGYRAAPGSFDLWMAVVGGGSKLLIGLWLRRSSP